MKLYISPSTQEKNVGPGGYIEEVQMNLIADILIPELIRHSQTIKRNNRLALGVKEICDESDAWGADYHIAIHSNAFNGNSRGLLVFCYDPLNLASKGTQLAKKLFAKLSPLTQSNEEESKSILSGKATMSEIAHTNAAAVLMEIDFHDTVGGAKWIMENISNIAQAILLGILEQLGVAYIPKIIEIVGLKKGDNNEQVSLWQLFLNLQGSKIGVDDEWGTETENATVKFMGDNGFLYSGYIDFSVLFECLGLAIGKTAVLNETIKSLTNENAMCERDIKELTNNIDNLRNGISAFNKLLKSVDTGIIK